MLFFARLQYLSSCVGQRVCACVIYFQCALPGGDPHTVMENLTSGWRSRWNFDERAPVSASIRISSAFLPNVCPHSSPAWYRCQSASLQHVPTTARSHRFFKQGKAKQILHNSITLHMYLAGSGYVPYLQPTANQADMISQEIYVSLSNI